MTNEQAIDAVLAWVAATVPEIGARIYDYVPAGKDKGLPDCACELQSEGFALADDAFPINVQQAGLYIWRFSLSIMADAGIEEAQAKAAQDFLYSAGERLRKAIAKDHTLGARVPFSSPWAFSADYSAPMVEWEDGTRGRGAEITLAVAELLADEG